MSDNKNLTSAADINAASKLSEKYRDKEAHEERDITIFSGVLVLFLHILSGGILLYSASNLEVSSVTKTALLAVVLVIAISIEYMKSSYIEQFFILKLKSMDIKKYTLEVRKFYLDKSNTKKVIVGVFWAISFLLLAVSLSKTAIIHNSTNYDTTIKEAYIQSTAALKSLTERGAKAATLKAASEAVERNGVKWEVEKASAEGKNYDSILYSILEALLICLALECSIFYARQFHEKTQYKIQSSFEEALEESEKAEKKKDKPKEPTAPTAPKVDESKYLAMLEAKVLQLDAANKKLVSEQKASEVVIQNSEINKILNGSPK